MTDIVFISVSLLTVGFAILALEARELVYGAVALSISFLGAAALFILLDSIFIAIFQVLVYVGSIAILIVFVIMLVRREKWISIKGGNERTLGIIAAVLLFSTMGYFSLSTSLTSQYPDPSALFNFTEIGSQLINEYSIILQLTGLALAVSIVGALTMAKFENR
tara:strand:+ start:6018 stop:6509 length:492 start_codon:yes stop_codon:yes gene_type:complete